jgi:peptidoglycan/LPS O-acetylase OafA/YrhL
MLAAAHNQTDRVWQPGAHCLQLDGIRGLAILIVTLYRFSKEMPTDSLAGSMLHSALEIGSRGVDLFFVLSGFLITGVLLQAKGQEHFLTGFYWRRTLRIFPLYFLTLAALLLLVPALFANTSIASRVGVVPENEFFLWTYCSNIKMAIEGAWCFGALDHFWSLAVEEHFYLVWPLVVMMLPIRWMLVAAIGLAGVSTIGRIGFAAISDNGVATDVLTIFRLDGLCLGSALAIAIRSFPQLMKYRMQFGVLACLLLGLASLMQVSGRGLWTIPTLVWSMGWTCLLATVVTSKPQNWLARLFQVKPLLSLGRYSYAMYVFQCPQLALSAGFFSAATMTGWIGNPIAGVIAFTAIMFAINYAMALLSWHCLEKHCLSLKHLLFHNKSTSKQVDARPSTQSLVGQA